MPAAKDKSPEVLFYFQNGYPARRRSLVDDARFETLVVKQTKQSVLDEARQRANGAYAWEKLCLDLFVHVCVVSPLDSSLEPEIQVEEKVPKSEQDGDENSGEWHALICFNDH